MIKLIIDYKTFAQKAFEYAANSPPPAEFEVVQKVRGSSRRKIKYDAKNNLISKVHQPRTQTSLEYSPGSSPNKSKNNNDEDGMVRTYHIPRTTPSRPDVKLRNDKYKFGTIYKDIYKDLASFGTKRKSFNELNNRFSIAHDADDNVPKTPKNLTLKGIVHEWHEQTNDPRYGRASMVDDSDYLRSPPKKDTRYHDEYRFSSRGGFTANRSTYINDGRSSGKHEREFEDLQPKEDSQERIKIFDVVPDKAAPLKYQRKTGFGYTSNNLDYSLRYEYNRVPHTHEALVKEALDYKAQPSASFWSNAAALSRSSRSTTAGVYNNPKVYSRLSQPYPKVSPTKRKSNYLPHREIREVQISEKKSSIYDPRVKMTKEEYQLFQDFSTPKKTRVSITSTY